MILEGLNSSTNKFQPITLSSDGSMSQTRELNRKVDNVVLNCPQNQSVTSTSFGNIFSKMIIIGTATNSLHDVKIECSDDEITWYFSGIKLTRDENNTYYLNIPWFVQYFRFSVSNLNYVGTTKDELRITRILD